MQSINIHDIKSITLSEVTSFKKTTTRKAFTVRKLEVLDIHGNRINIDFFGHDLDSLAIGDQK
jgi:hypothetical protein